jgi:hypothetical protein
MSLVICSNQEKDGTTLRQRGSVYNAWSFRNPLSSTMTIPANSQVALQSCKVNVDGRLVFSGNNSRFYHYFGDKIDLDGETYPQINDVTSYPVVSNLLSEDESGEVVESSLDDFANRIRDRVRETTFHPNAKNQFECEVLRNASSLDFLGFQYQFKQLKDDDNVNQVPSDTAFTPFYRADQAAHFNYASGVFTRNHPILESVGISKEQPFSLTNGSFIVNISGTGGANASGVEWHVGLTRSINQTFNGFFVPPYNDYTYDDDLEVDQDFYADFAVARNRNGQLVLYDYKNRTDVADGRQIVRNEVNYFNNTNSSFQGGDRYNLADNNASIYTKVGFFSEGEDLRVSLYNSSTGDWDLITEYVEESANRYFKPVNQACWCLHPVLAVGQKAGAQTCKLTIEEFSGLDIDDYDATEYLKGGWYESMEAVGKVAKCQELETRFWNKYGVDNLYVVLKSNGSGGVDYSPVMILQESEVYTPSHGANAMMPFGFNETVVQEPTSGADTNTVIFESTKVPDLTSSMAMFVRLNNFTQNVTNAYSKNKSKILAHLPRFDNNESTGRLYFEPNNLIFIDLDNPNDIQVNEFDIDFCYINEQYATSLTGQSIVGLYFRKKPKELM